MKDLADAHIQRLARECVDSMGDVFWDFVPERDAPLDYSDPYDTAVSAVSLSLGTFAASMESEPIYSSRLRMEYRALVAQMGDVFGESMIVASLVKDAAWTKAGARAVTRLARHYGTSVLRNALALAEALGIEDGEAGL